MTHRETLAAFKTFANRSKEWMTSNNNDVFVYPDVPMNVARSVRVNFQIPGNETILYVRDSSFANERNQGSVITDHGIHYLPCNEEPDEIFFLPWYKINGVSFSYDCFRFYVTGNDGNQFPFVIERRNILKNNPQELVQDIQEGVAILKDNSANLALSAAVLKENYDMIFRDDVSERDIIRNYGDLFRAGFTIGNTVSDVIGVFQSRSAKKQEKGELFCELFRQLATTQRAEFAEYTDVEWEEVDNDTYGKSSWAYRYLPQ